MLKKPEAEVRRVYLSKRQVEVLILISEGCINKDIAKKMGISKRTVDGHIILLMKKCQVFSRYKLTHLYNSHKIRIFIPEKTELTDYPINRTT